MDACPPLTKEEKLELARRIYRDKDWFGWCFWDSDFDRVINEEDIPFVIHGLRLRGGHAGYRIAAQFWSPPEPHAKDCRAL